MQAAKLDTEDLKDEPGSSKEGQSSSSPNKRPASSSATAQEETSAPTTSEYTCCHCLFQTPATESRPIGGCKSEIVNFCYLSLISINF